MSDRLSGITWYWRLLGKYPNGEVYKRKDKLIHIAVFPSKDTDGFAFNLTARDARLLARRINQCLDHYKGLKHD